MEKIKKDDHNIKPHPARFPVALPEFFIKFLTDPHDLVVDPFCGSNTTGEAAEGLQRYWAAFELVPEYLEGSRFRFREVLEMQTLWSGVIFEHPDEYIVDSSRELVDATENFAEIAEPNGNHSEDILGQQETI